jgi:putative transposase
MARPLRIGWPGAWYHVTARGIERRDIFTADRDRIHWLELMPEFQDRFRLVLHAYVLMDNHFHLLVETPKAVISSAMQWLQTSYSMWFNRKHQRVGPLFQGRYKTVVVELESWALPVSRYVGDGSCLFIRDWRRASWINFLIFFSAGAGCSSRRMAPLTLA